MLPKKYEMGESVDESMEILENERESEIRSSTVPLEQSAPQNSVDSRTNTALNVAILSSKKQYAVSTRWEREVAENGPIKDFHAYFCCCAKRLGNMFVLLERDDGSPMVIAGPCWPFCMGVTVPLILGVSGLVAFFVLFNPDSGVPRWMAYVYIPCLVIVLMILFMVSCRDPGLMERVTDEEAGQGGWYWNEQVGSFRPPGALYCRECGVLIEGYDHLCPWTGTGIGRGNMLAFRAFVVGINVLCYFSVGLVSFVLLHGLAG